jgi:hypothetical protein
MIKEQGLQEQGQLQPLSLILLFLCSLFTGARTTSAFVLLFLCSFVPYSLFLQKVPPRARSYLAGLVGMTAPFEGGGCLATAQPPQNTFFPHAAPSFRVKRSGTEEPPSPVIATPSASLGAAFIPLFLIYRSKDNRSKDNFSLCSFVPPKGSSTCPLVPRGLGRNDGAF